ncbi:MAG: potassium channel family protein [Rhodococcus sp. (in: high G+C Gram-positive bacteria)]|uniref:potassium channel family protein n=1 Tax=Rhodococcus sp. TaxID=1831 RepID=UPI002AD86BA9|nr:potassium channel family protein [Rhodococcus sp. (in: high G+C Gram-positive bacteria)]
MRTQTWLREMSGRRSRMTDARWKELTDWPMAIAAIAFLAAYAYSVLRQPSNYGANIVDFVMMGTWALFVLDYVVRLTVAERRLHWFLWHLHELAIIALPILRPLRLLRLVALIGIVQRTMGGALRGKVVTYAVGSTVVLIVVASLAMLDAERTAPDATITSYSDALWWASATVTTVGYGDYSPVTGTGRLIALGLMIAGIALLGVVTATLASWLVQKVGEQDLENQSATRAQVVSLTEEVAALRRELAK